MKENLWPTDFGTVVEETPLTVLRQQAVMLGERTKNLVEGRVSTRGGEGSNFRHELFLYSSLLGVSVPLVWVEHGIDLYPATVGFANGSITSETADNADEFANLLKSLFALPQTKKAIASLIAQSK